MSQDHKIDVPSTSIPSPSPSLPGQGNRPCQDLFNGSREEYYKICLPLYEASFTGDWVAAKVIFDKRPELVRFAITERSETPLHVAASGEPSKLREDFIENIVNMMEKEDLELLDRDGTTCLHVAAYAGSKKIAEIMLNKHKDLHTVFSDFYSPLRSSVTYGNHDLARYLYDVSEKMTGWKDENRNEVFCSCVKADMFDIALEILTDCPDGIPLPQYIWYVLDALARKPDALNRKERNIIWKIIDPIVAIMHIKVGTPEKDYQALHILKSILDTTVKIGKCPSRALLVAAEMGNTRFVIEFIRAFPDQLLVINDKGQSIIHIAIMLRHEGIYNLLYEIGSKKRGVLINIKDVNNNNILHCVGMTSKKMKHRNLSGASLLMQRELLWFKEVEMMMLPFLRDASNKDNQTPYELFSEQNQDVVSQGLKWMKDCMLVATLIITVAFAVVFTVPGGYNQENGIPIFIHGSSFLVFVIADAISLISSSTSLLVFLSIITSQHNQRDFLYSLPKKLMLGLATLFISVAAMMITFAASFFVLYGNRLKWVPALMSVSATIPVIIFGVMQFPLLVDMFRSMYDSRYLFKPKKRMLYNTKPAGSNS